MVYSYTFKVIVTGDNAVGKTALINRYMQGEFTPEYFPTTGTNVSERAFDFRGCSVKLSIWDIGGEKKFDEMVKDFYMNAQAAVTVFEVSRRSSFESIDRWYSGAFGLMHTRPLLYIVGNKLDLAVRQVDEGEARRKAEQSNAGYFETSAKSGENVNELFKSILKDLLRQRLTELRARVA